MSCVCTQMSGFSYLFCLCLFSAQQHLGNPYLVSVKLFNQSVASALLEMQAIKVESQPAAVVFNFFEIGCLPLCRRIRFLAFTLCFLRFIFAGVAKPSVSLLGTSVLGSPFWPSAHGADANGRSVAVG